MCELTGVCVGDVVMASYDFVSASTTCRERRTRSRDEVEKPRDGEERGGASSIDGRSPQSPQSPQSRNGVGGGGGRGAGGRVVVDAVDVEARNERLYAECLEVIERLFGAHADVSDEWKTATALRCRDCHLLCASVLGDRAASKTKNEYACLAALYLMREGLCIKGTRVCEIDATIAESIPSLNAVTEFGFQKSKYTRAYRTLMDAIDRAQYTIPLHELKI